MDDLSRFCCQNERCPDYGKRGAGNLRVEFRYGKDQRRMLKCRVCKARFSERKGTPMFGAHLRQEQVLSLAAHQVEGCGARKTERLTGVSLPTVIRYNKLFGDQAKALHDELVAFSPEDHLASMRRKMVLRGQKRKTV